MTCQLNQKTFLAALIVVGLLFSTQQTSAQTRYPIKSIHSPMTKAVVDNIKALIQKGASKGKKKKRFIKVGDSISCGTSFMTGLTLKIYAPADGTARNHVWLDYKTYLKDALEYYQKDTVPGTSDLTDTLDIKYRASGMTTSFDRHSNSTQISMGASWAFSGNPSPMRQEINALNPQFAVIMFGANDLGGGTAYADLNGYMRNLDNIADTLLSEDIIPLFRSTVPKDRGGFGLMGIEMDHTRIARYILRAYCQQKMLPFLDLNRAFMRLRYWGMGADMHHPNGVWNNLEVWFSYGYYIWGYPTQNLLVLETFDRLFQVLEQGKPSLNPEPPAIAGSGTQNAPWMVDGLPFVDAKTTSSTNPSYFYKFDINKSIGFRGMVLFQDAGVDIGIKLLSSSLAEIAAGGSEPLIEQTLSAGSYYVKVETKGSAYGDYQVLIQDRNDPDTATTGIVISGTRATGAVIGTASQTDITVSANITFIHDTLRGTISQVTADLSALNGGTAVAMPKIGATTNYSCVYTVPAGLAPGEKTIRISAKNNFGDIETEDITVTIDPAMHSRIPMQSNPGSCFSHHIAVDGRKISVKTNSAGKLSLIDLSGRLVSKTITAQNSAVTTWEALPSGVYFSRWQSNGNSELSRIIIK